MRHYYPTELFRARARRYDAIDGCSVCEYIAVSIPFSPRNASSVSARIIRSNALLHRKRDKHLHLLPVLSAHSTSPPFMPSFKPAAKSMPIFSANS
jgi:hypothetical protein